MNPKIGTQKKNSSGGQDRSRRSTHAKLDLKEREVMVREEGGTGGPYRAVNCHAMDSTTREE